MHSEADHIAFIARLRAASLDRLADWLQDEWDNGFRVVAVAWSDLRALTELPSPAVDTEELAIFDREALGQKVREVWIDWASEQPNPKASWLVPWEGLSEPDREVDRRIGEALAAVGAGWVRGPVDQPVVADAVPTVSVQELALKIYQGGLAQGCHQNTIARKLLARYDIRERDETA